MSDCFLANVFRPDISSALSRSFSPVNGKSRWPSLGVWAPVPHGVFRLLVSPFGLSSPVGEYMPKRVDAVRLSIDRDLCGGLSVSVEAARFEEALSRVWEVGVAGSVSPGGGVAVEIGVSEKVPGRRGAGRWIFASSIMCLFDKVVVLVGESMPVGCRRGVSGRVCPVVLSGLKPVEVEEPRSSVLPLSSSLLRLK